MKIRLTPDRAFLGTSFPLMPSMISNSKPVKEEVNFIASSLSLRAGTLRTKTLPNYFQAALSANVHSLNPVSTTYPQRAVMDVLQTLLSEGSFAIAKHGPLVLGLWF